MSLYQNLKKILGENRVGKHVDLSAYTTIGIKSRAKFFFESRSEEDLKLSHRAARELGIPFLLIGGGSNIATVSQEIEGLIVCNRYQEKKRIEEKNNRIIFEVSSGYLLSKLIQELAGEGFSGIEYLFGIPGTVGGAVCMNAKWTNPMHSIGDSVEYAYIIDRNSSIRKVGREYFKFAKGYSVIQDTKEVLISVGFLFEKSNTASIKETMNMVLEYRKKTQPQGVLSNGCFFKNPTPSSAGFLIEKAGLKGFSVGNFSVSNTHANYIVHKGGGTGKDLHTLIDLIKQKVEKKFGIVLKEEVVVI